MGHACSSAPLLAGGGKALSRRPAHALRPRAAKLAVFANYYRPFVPECNPCTSRFDLRPPRAGSSSADENATSSSSSASSSALSRDGKTYHAISTAEADFLIAANGSLSSLSSAGWSGPLLTLTDMFVKPAGGDEEAGEIDTYTPLDLTGPRAATVTTLPPSGFLEVPWSTIESPDVMKGRLTEVNTVHKVVLVRVQETSPSFLLDMDHVVVLDGATMSATCAEVTYAEDKNSMTDPTLRMLADGTLLVVDATKKPDYEEIVKAALLNVDPSELEVTIPDIDERDAMEGGMNEPDVPAVDLA
jgi:hypothetical protein